MTTIKEIRRYTGLSQSKFAKKYGIPNRSIENWEAGVRSCPDYLISLLARAVKEDFKQYSVEYAFSENFTSVNEWQAIDGLETVTADSAEEAAKLAACTDGLEDALFRVYRLAENEFGEMEKNGEAEYFEF